MVNETLWLSSSDLSEHMNTESILSITMIIQFFIALSLLPVISTVNGNLLSGTCYRGCNCGNSTVSCTNLNLTYSSLLSVSHTLPINTTELILDNNNIDVFPMKDFPVLPYLIKISLQSNKLTDVPSANMTTKFPNLKVLDLSNNDIIEIENQVKLPNIEELYLDNNNIKYIRKYTFTGMPKLEIISILSNELEYVDSLSFFNLTNLLSLNLAVNKIPTLKVGIFDSFRDNSDIKLNLSYNQLEYIPFGLIEFEDINFIDFSENEIQSVDHNAFQNIYSVVNNINLEHNVLETIPLFKSLAEGEIRLNGNPLVCDCKLAGRMKQFEVNFNGICQHPSNLMGRDVNTISLEQTCSYCDIFKPCLNGGKCIIYDTNKDTYKCMCESPYTGDQCQHYPNHHHHSCSNSSCPENSICRPNLNNISTHTCQCKEGYQESPYQGSPCINGNSNDDQGKSIKRLITFITFGTVLFGGVIGLICLLFCWVRKYKKHESYMVVPNERTNTYYGGV